MTREALDVARYITDMTAQLEAMAIAARLDLLAYFLGMARAESEIFVRTNAVAEAERADEQILRTCDRTDSGEQFVRLRVVTAAHISSAVARKETRSP